MIESTGSSSGRTTCQVSGSVIEYSLNPQALHSAWMVDARGDPAGWICKSWPVTSLTARRRLP